MPSGQAVYVPLAAAAAEGLRRLARRERRHPRDQAVVLLLDGLHRAGVLDDPTDERLQGYGRTAPKDVAGG